jgi:hypothetical protein
MGEPVNSKQAKNTNIMLVDEDANFAKLIKDMFANEFKFEVFPLQSQLWK